MGKGKSDKRQSDKRQSDKRNLYRRGRVFYIKRSFTDETGLTRTVVQSTGKTSLVAARVKRDSLLATLALKSEMERLAAVQAKIDGTASRLHAIEKAMPHMTMTEAWGCFLASPKGKNDRGKVINPGPVLMDEMHSKWRMFNAWLDAFHPVERGAREVRSVTARQAHEYIEHVGKVRSPRTRNKTLWLLRLVFRVISQEAGCTVNPFAELQPVVYAEAKKRGLGVDQLRALSAAVDADPEMKRLFLIGFHTGARLGDCCLLRWQDVDLAAGTVRFLPRKSARTNRDVYLNLAPHLLGNLSQTPAHDRKGYILPALAALYRRGNQNVSRKVQDVFRKAGIEPSEEVDGCAHRVGRYGFHSLRAHFITSALQRGAVLEDVRCAVGHSSVEVTVGYYRGGDAARKVPLLVEGTSPPLPPSGAATRPADAFLTALGGLPDHDLEKVRAAVVQEITRRAIE